MELKQQAVIGMMASPFLILRPPEKNITKGPLEEEIPFGNNHFQVLC